MTTIEDTNGFVCYVNVYEVMQLPDMFASNVLDWLKRDIEAWQRSGAVDDEWYPLKAEGTEQLEARKDMLNDGVGTTPGINTHCRQSLHTND
jgi:hypothetical protein